MGNTFGWSGTETLQQNTTELEEGTSEAKISPDRVTSNLAYPFEIPRFNNVMRTDSKRNGYGEERKRDHLIDPTSRDDCFNAMLIAEDGDNSATVATRMVAQRTKPRETSINTTENIDKRFTSAGDNPKSGSWRWLLAPDGSYATVDNTMPSQKRHRRCTIDSDTRIKPEIVASSHVMMIDSTKVDKNKAVSENDPKLSNWHWLLTPDGSFATGGNTSSSRKQRKRPKNDAITVRKRKRASFNEKKILRQKPQPSTWYWLLAPDGSCLTAGNPTLTRKRRKFSGANSVLVEKCVYSVLTPRIGNGFGQKSMEGKYGIDDNDDDEIVTVTDTDGSDFLTSISWKGRGCGGFGKKYCNRHWEERFQLLIEYKKKHKTTNVNLLTPVLGTWTQWQRRLYRHGKLSKERFDRLKWIGFDPSYNQKQAEQRRLDNAWELIFNRLVAYKNKHNTTVIPIKTPILGKWSERQRILFYHGQLSMERTERLNSIDFEWWGARGSRTNWMEMYNRLVAYKKEFKTTDVPYRTPDNTLGPWVYAQRSMYKMGKLDPKNTARLESIGFIFQSPDNMLNTWG